MPVVAVERVDRARAPDHPGGEIHGAIPIGPVPDRAQPVTEQETPDQKQAEAKSAAVHGHAADPVTDKNAEVGKGA